MANLRVKLSCGRPHAIKPSLPLSAFCPIAADVLYGRPSRVLNSVRSGIKCCRCLPVVIAEKGSASLMLEMVVWMIDEFNGGIGFDDDDDDDGL